MSDNQDPSTQCARGGWAEEFSTPPSNPPLYQTTAFDLHGIEQLNAIVNQTERGYIYTRDGNPNHAAFAQDIANLEGAEAGAVTASGMGAMAAILLGYLKSGDHVIAARVLYGRTAQQLTELRRCFNIEVTFVDAGDLAEVAKARQPNTKVCLLESISNPLMEVADVRAIADLLGEIPVVVDNTFATPCLFRPLEHGASIVFHSASKYLNGHGDVMLGVVVGDKAAMTRVRRVASVFGLNANPFECWLASRGLRTLPIRMRQVSESALKIATWLESHRKVARVFYPGLTSHAHHELANRLLPQGHSGMLSFETTTGEAGVAPLFRALGDSIPFSPTLADTRTTVSYPAGTSHKYMDPDERRAWGISDGLVRLSVGIDSANDVIRELDQALSSIPD